jgi:cytochrome oxidase Cu insertion factor (SCO1/SenC/PrrC family)
MSLELSDTNMQQKPGSGRKVLLILAVIFLLPFTVAAVLHLLQFHPGGHSYGELINPPKALQFPVLHDAQGKPFGAKQWDKKWSIVTIVAQSCNDACHKMLHLQQQVHISLGKEIDRVQRVLLIPAEVDKSAMLDMQNRYPNLIILTGADADTARFASMFDLPGQATEKNQRTYLVDPMGNLMMSYPQKGSDNLDPKGLRKDITRLLKNSWAG